MYAPLVFVYSDSLFPPRSCKDRNCSACYTSGLGLACHISSNCSSVLTVASQDEAYHRYRNAPTPTFVLLYCASKWATWIDCFWVLYVDSLSFGWSLEVIKLITRYEHGLGQSFLPPYIKAIEIYLVWLDTEIFDYVTSLHVLYKVLCSCIHLLGVLDEYWTMISVHAGILVFPDVY